MGIHIHGIAHPGSPFASLSEQVMAIPPDQSLDLENRSLKVVYFIGGNGELRLDDGTRLPIHAGDLFVLPHPCRQHYLAADRRLGSRLHALIVRLDPEAGGECPPLAVYLREAFPGVVRLPTRGWFDFRDGWMALQKLRDLPATWHQPLARALVTVWLARAAEKMARHPALPTDRQWEAIDRTAARLAESVGPEHRRELERLRSDPALVAAFTRHFGKSPVAFSLETRLERAKAEMARLSEPLSQIARRTGFSSSSTFSRAFRHATGLSPTAYRNQYESGSVGREPVAAPRLMKAPCEPETPGWRALALPRQGAMGEAGVLFPQHGCCEVQSAGKGRLRLSEREVPLLWVDARSWLEITETVTGSRVVFFPFSRLWPDATVREQRHLLRQCRAAAGAGGVLALPVERLREVDALRAALAAPVSPHATQLGHALVRTLFFGSLSRLESGGGAQALRASPRQPLVIEHVHEYIRKNLHRPMSLADVAWDAGVSEEHLARLYRAVTGETLFGFIKACRLAKARELLVSTTFPVHRVAEKSGFSSAGLFGRTFKAAFGETPGAFRRRNAPFGKGISSRDHDATSAGG